MRSNILIMARPRIQVVCGRVIDVNPSGQVTIENDCYLPVTEKTEKRRVRFSIGRDKMDSMGLNVATGAPILATVKPEGGLDFLADGGEDDTKEYVTSAYNMRYSGSFDFEQRGNEKEAHVFCGTVEKCIRRTVGGRSFNFITVVWKRCGETERRVLVEESEDDTHVRNLTKGIFVTGPLKRSASEGPIYKVKQIYALP